MISFTIPGAPLVKGRPRLNRRTGGVYTPRPTILHEEAIAWHARACGVRLEGEAAIVLRAKFFCNVKRGMTPDLDNLLKSLLDGLQKGELFANDRQIQEIHAERFDGDADPRTEVEVEWL